MRKKSLQNRNADQQRTLIAEETLIGGIILDNGVLSQITELINEDDFQSPENKKIFNSILALDKKSEPFDLVAVGGHLEQCQKLDEVGGISYLSSLIENVHASANFITYAKIVQNNSLLRKVITISTEIIEQNCEKKRNSLIVMVERLINKIAKNCKQSKTTRIDKIVKNSFIAIDSAYRNSSNISGVTSGFWELDSITNGFHRSDLIVIAGRPGMGKTSLALNIAKNCAEQSSRCNVVFFSLETSKEQLVTRLLSSLSEMETQFLRQGLIEDLEWPRLSEAAALISRLPIYMDDTPGINISEMRSKIRHLKKDEGLDMVIVDYLQLIRGDGESREQEMSEIIRSLKDIAKEFNVPVVVLSQLNRDVESRSDKRPQISDLREAEDIENNADVIMFVYRDELYNTDNPYNENTAEIIIRKQRNGPTGVVYMRFLSHFSSFLDLHK